MEQIKYAGYYPGLIGEMIRLHGQYYTEHHGFDLSFESQEAHELGEFAHQYDPSRDFWGSARAGNLFAGSIAIDGRQDPELGSRLRWFIVDPRFQGKGVGQELISRAVAFSRDAGHKGIYLWTFEGLDAARRLYLKAGFEVDMEREVEQWGDIVVEQRYVIKF
jgi:GNAT superfamily N-acetyltransferase